MVSLENKKPRLKNRGLCCGPIGTSGSNRVVLLLLTMSLVNCFKSARLGIFLDVSSLETPFSKWENELCKGKDIIKLYKRDQMIGTNIKHVKMEDNSLYCFAVSSKPNESWSLSSDFQLFASFFQFSVFSFFFFVNE